MNASRGPVRRVTRRFWTAAIVAVALILLGGAVRNGPALAFEETERTPDQRASTRGIARCARPHHPGGDWPSLNHDLQNSRNQPAETVIGVEEAAALVPAWSFSVAEWGGHGGLQSTPIVAGGCVYVVTGQEELDVDALTELIPQPFEWRGSRVFALNADTGELVWQTELNGFALGLAVDDGRLYAMPFDAPEPGAPSGFPEPAGAHAVALDAATGEVLWASERLDGERRHGSWVNASPVLFTPSTSDGAGRKTRGRSMLFVPLSSGWGDGARIPLHFVDARTGSIVAKFFALPQEDHDAGYGGAGIWTTAAFDPATNHLYAGTADSEGHRRQHPRNNAILKIDADPRRSTFASIVGTYSGTSEHYDLDRSVPGWRNNPVCETQPAVNDLLTSDQSASAVCLENDLDFGSSPNLYVDARGRTIVAALQKSGVLHAVDTAGMEASWTRVLSVPHQLSNASTGAFDGADLYVRAFPDLAFSFERTSGSLNWASSTGTSPFAYQPLTLANGVIYTITDLGQLVALEARSGRVLLSRPISADADVQSCYGWGAGVAVARNTVYAPCDADQGLLLPGGDGALVAYRVGGQAEGGNAH